MNVFIAQVFYFAIALFVPYSVDISFNDTSRVAKMRFFKQQLRPKREDANCTILLNTNSAKLQDSTSLKQEPNKIKVWKKSCKRGKIECLVTVCCHIAK